MAISEREANALVGFYTGLRKVVVVAGIVVLVAAVLAVVGGAYIAGEHKALPVAEKKTENPQPEDKPQPEKRVAPVRHRRIAPPPEPADEPEVEAEPENIQPAPVAVAPIAKPAPEPVAAPAPGPVVFVATVGEKHYKAHHKGRGGCDGDLFLTDTQLHFACPSLPWPGLTFERNTVSAHDDGIRDIASGHKYHFKVTGLDKQGARILFNRWVRDGMAAELAAVR